MATIRLSFSTDVNEAPSPNKGLAISGTYYHASNQKINVFSPKLWLNRRLAVIDTPSPRTNTHFPYLIGYLRGTDNSFNFQKFERIFPVEFSIH